jgi:lipopolysaccharide/colanic/teichoic acid biosynthesis glycosyltransferase
MTLMPVTYDLQHAEPTLESVAVGTNQILNELAFKRMIAIERKRTERTNEPFLLILLEASRHQGSEKTERVLGSAASTLLSSFRETDVIGWHKDRTALGVVCTGLLIKDNAQDSVPVRILNRVTATLRRALVFDQFNQIAISYHLFPDEWDRDDSGTPSNRALYPDLTSPDSGKRFALAMKRVVDTVGSALILALCAPLFLAIALAVKATSKGPVFFKQERVGRYGQRFAFLKFRSMLVGSDNSVHKEFVTKFIADEAERQPLKGNGESIYKLVADNRVTRVGRFLRRTSLDELPQLLNVLKGDMSLIGPRPPIPYELAVYQTWHRRRVLEAKPGITGLWQVTGRSRVKFDEMVRLDLRYSATWSPWLDLKILLLTPLAVIKGSGAC